MLEQIGVILNIVIDSGLFFNLILQLQIKQFQLQNRIVPDYKSQGINGKSLKIYLKYTINIFNYDLARKIAKKNCTIFRADIGGLNMILSQP